MADEGAMAVDIRDFGIRGRQFTGSATMSEQKLVFEDSEVEISPIIFSMTTSVLILDGSHGPALEYDGKPARMRIHLSGEVLSNSPGKIVVSMTGISPRILDSNEQQLGTEHSEEIIRSLASKGILFPKGINTSNPFEITFSITASDENYSDLYITSDADFFQNFKGQQ